MLSQDYNVLIYYNDNRLLTTQQQVVIPQFVQKHNIYMNSSVATETLLTQTSLRRFHSILKSILLVDGYTMKVYSNHRHTRSCTGQKVMNMVLFSKHILYITIMQSSHLDRKIVLEILRDMLFRWMLLDTRKECCVSLIYSIPSSFLGSIKRPSTYSCLTCTEIEGCYTYSDDLPTFDGWFMQESDVPQLLDPVPCVWFCEICYPLMACT